MMCEEKKKKQAAWPFQRFGKLVHGVGGSKQKVTDIRMPHFTSTCANAAVGAAQGRAARDGGEEDKDGEKVKRLPSTKTQ